MRRQLHHFYHAYVDGTWQDKFEDHLRAMKTYGLYDNLSSFNIGIVGSDANYELFLRFLDENDTKYTIVAHETAAWEQITLDPLWEMAKLNKNAYFVYSHTKGAANFHGSNELWRKSMTRTNIVEWEKCVEALDSGYSTASCHYYPNNWDSHNPFWGGNFWWATGTHISALEKCARNTRHNAEGWIGTIHQTSIFKPKDMWPFPVFTPSEPY